jgi:arsenite-transporting ATPase
MAGALYGEDDPAQIYYEGRPQVLEGAPGGGFRLTIPLPFGTKGDITLRQTGDELFVHVGAHRRHIILPRALIGLQAARAKLDEDNATLTVHFDA